MEIDLKAFESLLSLPRPYTVADIISSIPQNMSDELFEKFMKFFTGEGKTDINFSISQNLRNCVKCNQIINSAQRHIESIDPLEEAIRKMSGYDFDTGYELAITATETAPHPEMDILLNSKYKVQLYNRLNISEADRPIYDQLLVNIRDGKEIDPRLFTPDVVKQLLIYEDAAKIESRINFSQDDSIGMLEFIPYMELLASLVDSYREEAEEWCFYWRKSIPDIFSLTNAMAILSYLFMNSPSQEHSDENVDNNVLKTFLTFAAIQIWHFSYNWQEFTFGEEFESVFSNPVLRIKFEKFINGHTDGSLFKSLYASYCVNNNKTPIINVKSIYRTDTNQEHKNQHWFCPLFGTDIKDEQLEKYCRKVEILFDRLVNEGFLIVSDQEMIAQKELFRYRFTGSLPAFSLDYKLQWIEEGRGSKASLAAFMRELCNKFYENRIDRYPYKDLSQYFNIKLSNPSAQATGVKQEVVNKLKNILQESFK